MNRPNNNNYPMCPTDYYLKGYYDDLERYCDWLEDKIEIAKSKSLFQYIDQLEEENRQLRVKLDKTQKALDKACLELELSNKQLRQLDNRFLPMTSKDWKEYLLKDE